METKKLIKIHKRLFYYYDINSDGLGNIYFPKFVINKSIEEIDKITKDETNVDLSTVKEALKIASMNATSGVIIIRKEVVKTLIDCLDKIINETTMKGLKNKINTPEGKNVIDTADTLSDMVLFHRNVRKNAKE